MGLNNYSQMGLDPTKAGLTFFMPVLISDLRRKKWKVMSIGQHHTLGVDTRVQCSVWKSGTRGRCR